MLIEQKFVIPEPPFNHMHMLLRHDTDKPDIVGLVFPDEMVPIPAHELLEFARIVRATKGNQPSGADGGLQG